MGLIRSFVAYEDQFTQLPNRWLRDERLSRRARGLLAEVMSHRVGWRVSVSGLQKAGPEGRDAIRSMIEELRSAGYLRRTQARGDAGRFNEVEYELADPFSPDETADGFSGAGQTDGGSPDGGSTDIGQPDTKEEHHLEDQSSEDQELELFAHEPAALRADEVKAAFDSVWQAWPRNESKAAAVKAWAKAVKKTSVDILEGAALAWAYGAARRIEAGEFQPVPYLASWLNQERWGEEPPAITITAPIGHEARVHAALDLGARMDAARAAAEQGAIAR